MGLAEGAGLGDEHVGRGGRRSPPARPRRVAPVVRGRRSGGRRACAPPGEGATSGTGGGASRPSGRTEVAVPTTAGVGIDGAGAALVGAGIREERRPGSASARGFGLLAGPS